MRLILFILLFCSTTSQATNYYISTSGSNSNNGTSSATPWQTMAKVTAKGNDGTIHAGDSILFKRGDTFTSPDQFGGMLWWSWAGNTCPSGTLANPIVFSAYGTGAKPNFIFPNPTAVAKENRIVMSFEGVDYIIIDGLQFYDTRFNAADKVSPAYTAEAILFGESGEEANHCIVRNCYFNNIGMGVVATGSYNKITLNSFYDLKNVRSANDGSDYGANAITLGGSHNEVTYNFVSGAWAYSESFGLNGGAIEFYNTNDSNIISYNTFWDCGGIGEFGGQSGTPHCYDNLFSYNKIINCGGASYINVAGTFAIQPRNMMWWNNVFVENDSSRFSGSNFGAGMHSFPTWPTLPVPETRMFSNNGSPTATTVWNLQNNIFYNTNNMDMGSGVKTTHLSNVYKLSGGSTIGWTAGATELSTSAAVWVATTNPFPYLWDFRINSQWVTGQNLGLATDFAGTEIVPPVSAGVLQYTTPVPATNSIILFNTIIR